MYTVTVKYQKPTDTGCGAVVYRLAASANTCDIDSGIRLYVNEWDKVISRIDVSDSSAERLGYLRSAVKKIENDIRVISRISRDVMTWRRKIDLSKVANLFRKSVDGTNLRTFADSYIQTNGISGHALDKVNSAINNFLRYLGRDDISIHDIDAATIKGYEAYLSREGFTDTTAYTYLNSLRALYNRAITLCGICDAEPFAGSVILSGRCFTSTRPKLTKDQIAAIAALPLKDADLVIARDVLLLIYHTGLTLNRLLTIKCTSGKYIHTDLDGNDPQELQPNAAAALILSSYKPKLPYILPILNLSLKSTLLSQATYYRKSLKPLLAELGTLANLPFDLSYRNIR